MMQHAPVAIPCLLLSLALPSSLFAQEPSYVPFGTGCPGSFGTPVLEAGSEGLPRVGEIFSSRLSTLPAFGFAIGFSGLSKTRWGMLDLPLDLDLVGMPGCLLFTDIRQQTALAINGGVADWDINLPDNSALLGVSFFQQALVFDALVPGLGAAMSNAAEGTIGDLPRGTSFVEENFANDRMMDLVRSSGVWSRGLGIFGKAGGDGRLGAFDITDGRPLNLVGTLWEWSTDGMTITSDELMTNSFLGGSIQVDDGVFQFTDFVLPERMTLRFVGRRPALIFVRGRCEILGRIEVNAIDRKDEGPWAGKARDNLGNFLPLPQSGDRGTFGGAGGATGGRGAQTGGVGFQGGTVRFLAGHIYLTRRILTGGRGGPLVPAHGDPSLIDFTTPPPDIFGTPVPTYSQYVAGGGGGGGHLEAGQDGLVLQHAFKTELLGPVLIPPLDPTFLSPGGPNVGGGIAFDFLPKPDAESSNHYVIGGSGGGGGGSHAILAERSAPPALVIEPVLFNTGAGGAGGGGAFALRVGGTLSTGSSSVIECRGGSAANQTRIPAAFGPKFPDGIAAPGGGGSGGSILLMVDGVGDLQGRLDVSGGTGGVATLEIPVPGSNSKFGYDTRGGDGGSGHIRLEVAQTNPTIDLLGAHLPAGSGEVAEIAERWPLVAFQSLWYDTGQFATPVYDRYEIEAEVDGVTVTYSDDPNVGVLAQHGDTPLAFYLQGADVVPGLGHVHDPRAVQGWHETVASLDTNGFRWLLILDRDFGADVVIKRVRIVFTP